ncbi:hypothetical protein [Yeosuana marina]|uniref:hypothetical protein n=1 Tax=Yeosuana marina TaxID=1565536 RepID=UPI00141ECD0C|nr:hypothetical protein [Yeosuana marina]
MKKSIKILTAFGILILMSITTQAQINDWTGKWNTRLVWNNTLGDLNITESRGTYTGVFPNGKLSGKINSDGDLKGFYTRTVNSLDRTGMGKMGEFRFVIATDKKSYVGYYKVEGKDDWQPDNWNGKRPAVPTLVQQVEMNKKKKVLKDYVKNNPVINWTGTWETDNIGTFKVWVKGYQQIVGKFSYTKDGALITADVTGNNTNDRGITNNKIFNGTFLDSQGAKGSFLFYFGNPTDNDFAGYMDYDMTYEEFKSQVKHTPKSVYVKGHRTSSAKPNMNAY